VINSDGHRYVGGLIRRGDQEECGGVVRTGDHEQEKEQEGVSGGGQLLLTQLLLSTSCLLLSFGMFLKSNQIHVRSSVKMLENNVRIKTIKR